MPHSRPIAFVLPTAVLLTALAGCASAPTASAAPENVSSRSSPADTSGLPAGLAGVPAAEQRLKQAVEQAMSTNGVSAVASAAGATYTAQGNGTWLFKTGQPVPGQDTLTLTLKAKDGGRRLRVDFMEDASLPHQGPGLASNGNFCLSGVVVTVDGQPAAIASVASAHGEVGFKAENMLKPATDASTHEWNASAHLGGVRTLEVVLAAPAPAGATLAVKLDAKSRWGQHVPGALRATVTDTPELAKATAELKMLKKGFSAWVLNLRANSQTIPLTDARIAILTQAELLRAAGEAQVWEVLKKKDGERFLRAFLSDQAWLESFLLGGQEGTTRCDYGQSLENLRLLFSQSPKDTWKDPVSKRLATAMAIESGAMNRWRLVDSFRQTDQARLQGRLHAGFDQLDVRAMRHAILPGSSRVEFEGWLSEVQSTAGGYVGACWAVPYVDPSTYGYSVQGWGFHNPLYHAYPTAKIYRSIGGVCGTLSRFGAGSGTAHGVPAFTVGQPSHCAYVVRIGDSWATGNDVSGPGSNSWTAYEGLSFTSTNALLEKTENAPEYVKAQRLLWAARQIKSAGNPTETWKTAYETAIKAQPTNYAAWLEYIKAMEETKTITPKQWADFDLMRAATTFKEHPEAAWALVFRCLQAARPHFASAAPAGRATLLEVFHRILNQNAVPTMYGYDVGGHLNWQAQFIGDDAAAVNFFRTLLHIHHSDKPELNWVFGNVMGWGNGYFTARPAVSAAYAKAIGDFLTSLGDKADKGQAAAMIAQGIRKAGDTGDAAAYRSWQALAAKLLPPVAAGDLYLNPQQEAARPKFEPFPGAVLSATGMLQTSSQVVSDRPLSYARILDGSAPGFFDTANEVKPWAQVTLAGDGELSGIVLVDRYEYEPEQAWDVPLKVTTSTDGKTWTEVALFDKPQAVYRVDLQGKALRAKFVRIERQQQPANGRLHLRNFVVYGKKLY